MNSLEIPGNGIFGFGDPKRIPRNSPEMDLSELGILDLGNVWYWGKNRFEVQMLSFGSWTAMSGAESMSCAVFRLYDAQSLVCVMCSL